MNISVNGSVKVDGSSKNGAFIRLAIICALSHVTKVKFVSMSMSVLKLTEMATLFTTLTNTLNAIITKDNLHAHVKKNGLEPQTVQEAAQTTTNAPTVFKPSEPLLVAKQR